MTHREDLERVPPDVVPVASLHIVNADEQRVVHDAQLL